jgi:DNA-binding NarL/FixJ family response regulator
MQKIYTVVLADDNEIFRTGIAGVLNRTSQQPHSPHIEVVAEATRGEMALDFALRLRPNVLLLDISMPDEYGNEGMDGIQVVEALRTQNVHIPVLIMSNHTKPTYIRRLLGLGIGGYALKDDLYQAHILIKAIINVARGEKGWMTPRIGQELTKNIMVDADMVDRLNEVLTATERKVLIAVGKGFDDEEIAQLLSEQKWQTKMEKIRVSSLTAKIADERIDQATSQQRYHITTETIKTHRNNYRSKLQLKDRSEEILLAFKSGLVHPEDIEL